MAPSGIIAPGPAAGGAGAGTLVLPIAPLLFMPMVPGKENWGIVMAHTHSDWGLLITPEPQNIFPCRDRVQSINQLCTIRSRPTDLALQRVVFPVTWILPLTSLGDYFEFLSKKPIKWDHWEKKKKCRFYKEMNMHRTKEYSYLPCPSVPFACLVAPSGKTGTHFNW